MVLDEEGEDHTEGNNNKPDAQVGAVDGAYHDDVIPVAFSDINRKLVKAAPDEEVDPLMLQQEAAAVKAGSKTARRSKTLLFCLFTLMCV